MAYADTIEDNNSYSTSVVAVIFKGADAESPNPKRLEYDIRLRPDHFATASLFSYVSYYHPEYGK